MDIEPGTYVVAVSGGVDSMALLHMLRQSAETKDLKLIVAHFDHGIRVDSYLDKELVQETAQQYGLPFVYNTVALGPVSEDQARKARYDFLHRVRQAGAADAVVTAHHQDDLLETAIHNMRRGTARRGLIALGSGENLRRPLLDHTKEQLRAYALDQGLVWREDSTNQDLRYARNYIRHQILPRFSVQQRQQLLTHVRRVHQLHQQLNTELINHLHMHPAIDQLDRYWFIMLPHAVAREVLATWLRRHNMRGMTTKLLERLIAAGKTGANGTMVDVNKTHVLSIEKHVLALKQRER